MTSTDAVTSSSVTAASANGKPPGQRDEQVMAAGQVRALMREHGPELSGPEHGQGTAGDHDGGGTAGHKVGGGLRGVEHDRGGGAGQPPPGDPGRLREGLNRFCEFVAEMNPEAMLAR